MVTAIDREALDSALAALGSIVDRPPAEGSVRFEGITPIPVEPVPGQELDVPAAESVLQREWAFGRPVVLPLTVLPPITDGAGRGRRHREGRQAGGVRSGRGGR